MDINALAMILAAFFPSLFTYLSLRYKASSAYVTALELRTTHVEKLLDDCQKDRIELRSLAAELKAENVELRIAVRAMQSRLDTMDKEKSVETKQVISKLDQNTALTLEAAEAAKTAAIKAESGSHDVKTVMEQLSNKIDNLPQAGT